VVYIPPLSSTPLFILPQNETYYTLPGRGGVAILNLSPEERGMLIGEDRLRGPMGKFASTLRALCRCARSERIKS
jgi:hypothetical protein